MTEKQEFRVGDIMDYKTLRVQGFHEKGEYQSFDSEIRQHLHDHWELEGSPYSLAPGMTCQALVKRLRVTELTGEREDEGDLYTFPLPEGTTLVSVGEGTFHGYMEYEQVLPPVLTEDIPKELVKSSIEGGKYMQVGDNLFCARKTLTIYYFYV